MPGETNLFGQAPWERRGVSENRLQALTTALAAEAATRGAADTTASSAISAIQTADLVVPHIVGTGVNIATGGANWVSGQRFLLVMESAVLNFSGGNQNIVFPSAFPNGLGSVVVSHGGTPTDTVLNTTNYSKTGCGISAISAGATVTGLLRIHYIALGW
jgi:hypothetical protein